MKLHMLKLVITFLAIHCAFLFSVDISIVAADTRLATGQVVNNHSWKQVKLPSKFTSPVVIVAPPTYNGRDPGVVQVQKVGRTSFQLRFKEWRYLDASHTNETFSYLVLDRGRHTMSDGSIWEVGTFALNGTTKWKSRRFSKAFPGTPTLLLTNQRANNSDPVTVRARRVSKSSFQVALFEEERRQNGHPTEQIGYLAIYSKKSSGTVKVRGKQYTYQRRTISLNHRFARVPDTNVSLKIEEERSKDRETSHTKETMAVLTLNGRVFAQNVSSHGHDTFALRQQPVNNKKNEVKVAAAVSTPPASDQASSGGSSSSGSGTSTGSTSSTGSGSTSSGGTTSGGSSPQSLTLSWDQNSEPDLAGYKVYKKTSSSAAFGSPVATLKKNVKTYMAKGLQINTTYYFGVTAVDDSGNESAFAEISQSIF